MARSESGHSGASLPPDVTSGGGGTPVERSAAGDRTAFERSAAEIAQEEPGRLERR